MLTVYWVKSTTGAWLSLARVDLSNTRTQGVYIIWHGGNPGRVVRVGQGDIADRLTAHKSDTEVLGYGRFGELFVTWADVSGWSLDGVERHLADRWKPLIGDRFPNAVPIAVNSPWG
jgi:hypothetical protein